MTPEELQAFVRALAPWALEQMLELTRQDVDPKVRDQARAELLARFGFLLKRRVL
jgi:hypothetical protein